VQFNPTESVAIDIAFESPPRVGAGALTVHRGCRFISDLAQVTQCFLTAPPCSAGLFLWGDMAVKI